MARGKDQQPRAITPDLIIQQELYRAGMYAELQKFGKSKEEWKQLTLSEAGELLEDPGSVEVFGLDFSVSEDKAFSALQILLDRTGYKGNLPGRAVYSDAFNGMYKILRMRVTPAEYLEVYGLERDKNGQFSRAMRDDAINALIKMTAPRRIGINRRKKNGKYDMVVTYRPPIGLTALYKDMEKEEAKAVKTGQDIPGRVTAFIVEFSPLFIEQIDSFYLLKPETLHKEIKELSGKRRISRSISLFVEWLLTLDIKEIKVSRENLAIKLRMEADIKQRQKARIDRKIDEALKIAKEAGYLLDYQEDAFGVIFLKLNPERCRRVLLKEQREAKQDN